MPASPNITLTANLETILGGAALTGYLEITLCGFGISPPRVAGTAMLADASIPQVKGPASAFSVALFGNDQITPANTFYSIAIYDQFQNVIQSGIYQLTGSGSFDLSQLTPITPPSSSAGGILTTIFAAIPTVQQATGTIDGVNTNFTFSAPAGTPTVVIYVGGVFQSGVANLDYSLTYQGGNVWKITFTNAPINGPVTVWLFQVNGSGSRTITAPSAIVISGGNPDNTLFCNFSAPGTITLPNPATAGVSYELTFTDISYNAVTNPITLAGTVNNGASYVINTNGGSVTLRSDGTAWRIKSKF